MNQKIYLAHIKEDTPLWILESYCDVCDFKMEKIYNHLIKFISTDRSTSDDYSYFKHLLSQCEFVLLWWEVRPRNWNLTQEDIRKAYDSICKSVNKYISTDDDFIGWLEVEISKQGD